MQNLITARSNLALASVEPLPAPLKTIADAAHEKLNPQPAPPAQGLEESLPATKLEAFLQSGPSNGLVGTTKTDLAMAGEGLVGAPVNGGLADAQSVKKLFGVIVANTPSADASQAKTQLGQTLGKSGTTHGPVTKRDLDIYVAAEPKQRVITQAEAKVYLDAHKVKWLVDNARAAGLDENQVRKLESILQNSKTPEADEKLVRDLLASENPTRALRTFNDLDIYRRQHPDRITPDIVRSLALGVGQARTDSSEGREGILGNAQAIFAAEALVRMPPADYTAIRAALSRAGGGVTHPADSGSDAQKEKALILKAVAARDERLGDYTAWNATQEASPACDEITRFAETIRGMNASKLMDLTSAIDLRADGMDNALQQRFNDSCVQATLQIARAEADPVYALQLHNEKLHSTSTMGSIADEQKNQLNGIGGKAEARGTGGVGTTNDGYSNLSNGTISPSTNRAYQQRQLENNAQSRTNGVDYIEQLVKTGTDVPISVRWNGGGGHALLVTDVRGTGADREFLITDPWNGRTEWVRRDDIINGNTNFLAGTGRLDSYWW